MRSGVIAKKVGMTRLFQEDGRHVPVTVLALEDCQVVSHRTADRDGYFAVQLGAGEAKQKNVNKPQREAFAKAEVGLKMRVAEFRVDAEDALIPVGSTISAEQRAFYARLFRHPRHVEAALAMMANWDLDGLERDLPRLTVPLTLIAAENDRFTPPAIADRVARIVPGAAVVRVSGLGHLAHEEDAEQLAALIRATVAAG